MAGPPARCLNPQCGYVFELTNLFGGSGPIAIIEMRGNSTRCPRCGSSAHMADGVYEYSDGTLKLKHGPPLTRSMINELAAIANGARKKTIETEELLAEIAGVSPELADKLREHSLSYFVIVLFLVWLIKSVSLDITVDVNKLIDQARGTATGNSTPSVLETPLPSPEPGSDALPHATMAMQLEVPMSRQVRRQLERQSRKENGRNART